MKTLNLLNLIKDTFAAWGRFIEPIIETTGLLYTTGSGEPMSASTINVIDYANTGATANPAVLLAGLTPVETDILRLQVMAGVSLTANCPFACS